MTVKELITRLEQMPLLNEVYVQTMITALQKVEQVELDKELGCVFLKWK